MTKRERRYFKIKNGLRRLRRYAKYSNTDGFVSISWSDSGKSIARDLMDRMIEKLITSTHKQSIQDLTQNQPKSNYVI